MHRNAGWKTGLYQCCAAPDICCLVTWCPCIGYGHIVGDLPEGSMCCAGNECGATASFMGLLCFESVARSFAQNGGFVERVGGTAGEVGAEIGESYLIGRSRELLRQKFRIEKPRTFGQSDCFVASCCTSCALCQELREVRIREEQPYTTKHTITAAPKQIRL
jgi:Cys-rich protein (TIGR01571 family)